MIVGPVELKKMLGSGYEYDTSGIKLHVAEIYKYVRAGYIGKKYRRIPGVEEISPMFSDVVYKLSPGAYLVRYAEYIKIPEGTIALVLPRSSLLRMGATIHTAVWDSGYEGRGVGMLVVYNNIEIEQGAHIAQMIFLRARGEQQYSGIFKGEK